MTSKNSNNLTVVIGNDCPGCDRVLRFLEKEKINCNILNIHNDKSLPAIRVTVIPALLEGEEVLAYGDKDIVGVFSKI